MADAQPRERILEQIREGIRKDTVVDGYGSLMIARQQMAGMGEDTTRAGTGSWEGILTDMLNSISDHLQTCLVMDFSHIADQADFLALLDPMFFRSEILEVLLKSLSDGTSRPDLCDKGPEVYQALVGSLLTGTKPDSDELILQPGSRYRVVVESTKEAVLSNIKRRWMQIKTARAFNSLDFWALKEISDGESEKFDLSPGMNLIDIHLHGSQKSRSTFKISWNRNGSHVSVHVAWQVSPVMSKSNLPRPLWDQIRQPHTQTRSPGLVHQLLDRTLLALQLLLV